MEKEIWKKCIAIPMVVFMMFIMVACEKRDNRQSVLAEEDIMEMTYNGTELVMDGIEGEPDSCVVMNGKLYVKTCQLIESDEIFRENDEDINIEGKKKVRLYTSDLDGSNLNEIPLNLAEGEYIDNFYVGNDDSIIYITAYSKKDSYGELVKLDVDGKELLRVDAATSLRLGENAHISRILVDIKGNIIVISDYKVYILDEEFQAIGEVAVEDSYRVVDTALAKDGQIVCVEDKYMSDNVSLQVCILDVDNKRWKEPFRLDINNVSGTDLIIDGLDDYDFYYKNDSGICGYDVAEEKGTKLMDYTASNLFSEEADGIVYMGDGKFIVAAYNFESEDGSVSLFVYSKADASVTAAKKTITVGTMFADDHMKKAAIEFNRRNKDYQIEFKEYYQEEDPSTRMNADIVAGNAADVIDVSSMPLSVDQCVEKGLLEDLTPYFEKDTELDTDDIIDSVLEAMKMDGKLYYAASGFTLSSIVGKTKDVGSGIGWTFDGLKALLKEKGEDVSLFDGENSKSGMLCTLLENGLTDFVDWETGECSFDSQDFRDILEICNERGVDEENEMSDAELQEMVASAPSRFREGKVLLEVTDSLSVEQVQIDRQKFGEDITYIGYPNKEKQGTYFKFDRQVAICSNSDAKEEAWEFIRIFMTKDFQGKNMTYAMPTRQDCFNLKMKEKMTTEPYTDEFGREIEPLEGTWLWGSVEMEQKPVSQEEVDVFVNLIENTKTCGSCDEEMLNIILEESQAYFSGRKKLDKTAKIIQKRITTYINEQR